METWLQTIAQVFCASGLPVYLVGGSVRNRLLSLPLSDIDICGPARPEQVETVCRGTAVTAKMRAAHFGTIELHVEDENGRHMAEYTTFRVDSYRCGHQPDKVTFADTCQVDALRRDFSVNALYQQLLTSGRGQVIDPTGGLAHLKAHVLHTVTPDPDQVLKDDGLRILRMVRFCCQLAFTPTEALVASAEKYVPLLADIAPERLHDELVKILLSDTAYPTLHEGKESPVLRGLLLLRRIGAFPYLLPGFVTDESVFRACAKMPPSLPERLDVLFSSADAVLAKKWLKDLCFSCEITQETLAYKKAREGFLQAEDPLFFAAQAGLPFMNHMVQAYDAMKQPTKSICACREEIFSRHLPTSLKELAVNGQDLLPFFEGESNRRIGIMLLTMWRMVVHGQIPNTKEALLAFVTSHKLALLP